MTDYCGAKWYKIDFHMHTNASSDYRDNESYSHETWLLKCMEQELDGVVIADHNTGSNIDDIKRTYETLRDEQHPNFRELTIFPAIELTVNGGIHLLVVFSENMMSSNVSRFLGAVQLEGDEGDIATVTRETLTKILNIASENPYNAICIPAHADKVKGIFEELQGETLRGTIKNKNIIAIEQIDKDYVKPQMYIDEGLFHHRVLGSDSHTLIDIAKNYTWLKMGEVSLDGIKMTLSDRLNKNIICSDEIEETINPNNIEHTFIKSIEVKDGYKIGRGRSVKLEFSPWLNTIVGGRGSGKSTIIKMAQYAFGKQEQGKFDSDFFKIGSRNGKGMLTENIEIFIEFSQYDDIIKLIKTEKEFFIEEAGERVLKDIQTIQELYPIVLITQKELFEMALEQDKLFRFIDRKINYSQWDRDFNKIISDYIESKSKERTFLLDINDKQLIEEKIKQTDKILTTYEKYDFSELIKEHKLYSQQASALETVHQRIEELKNQLSTFVVDDVFREIDFLSQDTPDISGFVTATQSVKDSISQEINNLSDLAKGWIEVWTNSEWKNKRKSIRLAYEELQKELAEQGRDIGGYNDAIKNHEEYKRSLKVIGKQEENYFSQCGISQNLLTSIENKRKELFDLRKSYIEQVNNRLEEAYGEIRVKFDITYLGNVIDSEKGFREVIERTDGKFDSEILLVDQYNDDNSIGMLIDIEKAESKEDKLEEIKTILLNIDNHENKYNGWFVNHIKSVFSDTSKEDRLLTWFPKDKLEVTIVLNGREESIETASPGQKATALMTYIITETDGPLIIDQPEDDLDNRMVTSLIVDGIRNIKENRQIIIITHNPNIPVNASAEQIFEMNYAAGQIRIKEEGTIQNKNIRESICDVMEGGVAALEHRFNKIIKI